MAQENPYAKYREQSQPVPISQIKPIIAAPVDPNKQAQEARAETGTQINVAEEARASREEVRKAILDLQSRYRADDNVKKYEGALPNYVAALKTQPTGSGDLALVYHFAKTVDPTSTVGTGDMENINETDARLPAMAQNALRQLRLSDGKFTNEAREGLRAELRSILDQRRQAYEVSRQLYAETAQSPEFNVNPELVIGKNPFGQRFEKEINDYWAEKGEVGSQQLGLEAGATFSTDKDKAIAAAVQQAWASGADVQGMAAAAEAAGGTVTPADIEAFQQAVEARAKRQPVTFTPAQSGQRSALQQAAGEFLMTPVGTALTGAVNATGAGLLSQVAGDQIQGLEALNPAAGLTGEVIGSALGTAGLAKGAAAGLGAVSPAIAARLSGGGLAGTIGREALTEGAYGGLYAANTGEDIGTGIALGAGGSLAGRAVGAGLQRTASPTLQRIGNFLNRTDGGPTPPDGGVPPMGGGPDVPPGGGVSPAGGMGGAAEAGVPPMGGGAAMGGAEEPFIPSTVRSGDMGAASTPMDLIRATQAAELGIDLMPFQRTRNFQDMQRAHELAKNGEIGRPIRQRFSEQQAAIAQKFDDYIEKTGSNIREDVVGQGAKITDAMQKMLDRDKARVRVLYRNAAKSDEAKTIVPLDQQIRTTVDGDEIDTTVIDWLNSQPTGLQTSGVTDAAKQLAVKLNIASLDKETGQLVAKRPTINALEQWRREINQTSDFNDANLQRQKSVLKDLIDSHTEPYATGMYAEARAARREVGRKYEDVSTIAQLLKTKRNTPERVIASEKVVEGLLKDGTSVANVKALRDLIKGEGGDPQAWKEVQGATLEYLRDKAFVRGSQLDEFGNRTMAVKPFQNAVRALDRTGKLDVILGFEKANVMRNLSDAAEVMFTAPPGSVNFSNTSSAWWNIADMLLNGALFQFPLPAGFATNVAKPLKEFIKDRPLKKEVSRLVGGSE